jgi:hypothetical protein
MLSPEQLEGALVQRWEELVAENLTEKDWPAVIARAEEIWDLRLASISSFPQAIWIAALGLAAQRLR